MHFPSLGQPLRSTYPRAYAHVREAREITLLRFDLRLLIQAPPEFVQIWLLWIETKRKSLANSASHFLITIQEEVSTFYLKKKSSQSIVAPTVSTLIN